MQKLGLKRRAFLGAGGSAVLVVGCGGGAELEGMPSASGGSAGAGGAAATCGDLTAPNIEGPFFTPNSPETSDLRTGVSGGTLLRVEGRVLGADCTPLAGALLDFWQADQDGAYDEIGFVLRGHQFTDEAGRYVLETIVPGHYLNGASYRPAHLHVKAQGPGTQLLTTQLYFEGDPYNESDPFIEPSLIMALEEQSGVLVASFDFVLPNA